MARRILLAVAAVLLSIADARGEVRIFDADAFPLVELDVTLATGDRQPKVESVRASFLAGALEIVRRPEWIKVRLVPLVFQKLRNQYHIQAIFLGTRPYMYGTKEGLVFELETEVGPSNASILSWRGPSDDPYLSGGMAALLGEILVNYGFRAGDGSRYRAWKLTDAFEYRKNEKHGQMFSSVGGWLFSVMWDVPAHERTWDLSLVKKCFCVGKRDGKTYGRVLWLPLGRPPALFSKKQPSEKKDDPEKPDDRKPRQRVSV